MHIDNRLIAALQVCTSKEELDDTFSLFHVTSMKHKQRYLLMAMYNPHVFFIPYVCSLEIRYRLTIEQFLAGHWRLYPLCKTFNHIEQPLADKDIRLLEKLKPCESQDDIDSVFDAEHIDGLENRIAALRRVMQATVLHSNPFETAETLADDYAFECAVFLEGSWRSL